MAEAFEAQAVGAHGFTRVVAVKRPLPGSSKEMLEGFLSEARLVARITHPNVIQTVDLDIDADQRPFMVMEYVDGCNLSELLAKVPRPSFSVSIYVVASILRGLGAAHDLKSENGRSLEIVHRDISPQNVFLSRDGMVKVGDWGIAKEMGVTARIEGGTEPGYVKGKLAYMAPEQLSGARLDRRADLYAVGLVLWEMLTGCTSEQRAELCRRGIERPSAVKQDVPADLERVVMTLLERDLDHRYEDAREAIANIEACTDARVDACDELADLVTSSPRRFRSNRVAPTDASRGWATSSRRRFAVRLLAVVAAAGMVAVVVVVTTRVTRRSEQTLPDAAVGASVDATDASKAGPEPVNRFVAIPGAEIDAQLALVSKEEYENFRQRLSADGAKAMLPLAEVRGLPNAPVTWVAFSQAKRYCASLQARLPTSEEWAVLIAPGSGGDVGRFSEWTGTVKDGLALVREPRDRRPLPADPLYKETIMAPDVRPDVVAGEQIGFRCVR